MHSTLNIESTCWEWPDALGAWVHHPFKEGLVEPILGPVLHCHLGLVDLCSVEYLAYQANKIRQCIYLSCKGSPMKMACLIEGNKVHKLWASMTSPASSQITVAKPTLDNFGQNLAQAVVVSPMTSSVHCVSEILQRVQWWTLRCSRTASSNSSRAPSTRESAK